MPNDREFTEICKEILALSEKIRELNLSRLEKISVEIKLAKNNFDDKSGEMDAKIAEFNKIYERLEPLKESLAKAEEILAKIKENGAGANEEEIRRLISQATQELSQAMEELKRTLIDDEAAGADKTYSSEKLESDFAKKSELPDTSTLASKEDIGAKIDEAKANELIAAKTANLANKTELAAKLNAATYNAEKAGFVSKSELNGYITTAQTDAKISQALAEYVRAEASDKFTKTVTLANAQIDFSKGVNFVGQNLSGSISALNAFAEENRGKSGLIYIQGNGLSGFSNEFQVLNPNDSTFSKGYAFLSYFVNPVTNKIIVQFIKVS